MQINKLETLITRDTNFLFTLTSYGLILLIYINLNIFHLSVLGILVSVLYIWINATFLGHAFFEKEATFFKLVFGIMLFIMLLGIVGLLVVIVYNLDVIRFTLVLFIAATLSSLLNRKVKNKNAA